MKTGKTLLSLTLALALAFRARAVRLRRAGGTDAGHRHRLCQ
jgi:hypothetical protein